MRPALVILTLAWLAYLPGMAESAEDSTHRYYVSLFGCQRNDRAAQWTHSFAVFVKATFDGDAMKPARVESFTISWMPASGVVRLLAAPEAGKNYTLSESFAWAARHGLRTTSWGPFEIREELYDLAVEQKQKLESGAISYKALDRRFRPNGASNCIHALSDVVPGPLVATGSAAGESATAIVVDHYRRYFVDPERKHDWVAAHIRNDAGEASE